MAGFDLKRHLAAYAHENTQALHALAERLPSLVEVNLRTGAVRSDKAAVRKLYQELFAEPAASTFATASEAAAEGGMLILKDGQVEKIVPLVALAQIARERGGLPKSVRDQLGISEAAIGAEVMRQVQRRFPGINPNVLTPEHVRLLLNDPRPAPNGNPGGGKGGGGAGGGGTGGSVGFPAIDCLIRGPWGPLFDAPLGVGWLLGFRVCLDHLCAQEVADLISPGPIGFAYNLLRFLENPETLVLAVAIGIEGILLAWNINAVNGPTGVCIHCTWYQPTPFGIGLWAAPQ